MIDIDNYGRSVAWMKRNLIALEQSPEDKALHYAVLQSFEVTFNLSEEVLRRAFIALETEEGAAYLSFREVIYRANDEGLVFTTIRHWLEYGSTLEAIKETFFESAALDIGVALRSLLTRYVEELERFTSALKGKLVTRA
ncbi:nucleotidyltransferase substrate binding protein [Terriglobus sp.]|uniref:nucleotidyltransferase substrate binding protein n=1 Tax=Terriglobus sp. TaxID=1889013 RepID=UPI003AFFC199